MDKAYDPKAVEEKIYAMWEDGGYFTPKIDKSKKPYSILLPLPNANDPMHMGHAMFTVQDILIRYHRMKGDPTLWLPGGDHAGIETQYVFEKKLAKEGKSRFQFNRKTFYHMIEKYVEKNKNINRDQLKRLGFSLDWTRYHYSLEPEIVAIVLDTFKKMHADGLVYRDDRLVNYCPKCGTGYSDLEIKHVQQIDPLYYMKYGPFILATVRPETKFGDTAVAVNPKDKRYATWIGKEIEVEGLLGPFKIMVVGDDAIDPTFGTGVAKVTPAHDFTDFEIAKRHNLPAKQVIGLDGRLTDIAGPYKGMKVKAAREQVVKDLDAKGFINHIDANYTHTVATCYKCASVLEPLPIPQWYVKTKPLAIKAIQAVKDGKTKIFPLKRFEKMYFDWMNNILDWNISRQIVWGPRIPVWYEYTGEANIWAYWLDKDKKLHQGSVRQFVEKGITLDEIKKGLQRASVMTGDNGPTYVISESEPKDGKQYIPETDTFDTWFLSSQWPYTTLLAQRGMTNDKYQMTNWEEHKKRFPDSDFAYFYPTSVLDTMWDILFFWVARMMMMGIYRTGKIPFEVIHLHSRVIDAKGQKMAKSKENVLNPIDLVDKYGADALRFTLVFGAAPGSDIAVSEDKIRGMRNFANKLWNIGRFLLMNFDTAGKEIPFYDEKMHKELKNASDKRIISELNMLTEAVTKDIERYRFSDAAQTLYEFAWHTFADVHLEKNKERFKTGDPQALAVLRHVYLTILKLLHPFMPFVTEEIWSKMPRKTDKPLIISSWPAQ